MKINKNEYLWNQRLKFIWYMGWNENDDLQKKLRDDQTLLLKKKRISITLRLKLCYYFARGQWVSLYLKIHVCVYQMNYQSLLSDDTCVLLSLTKEFHEFSKMSYFTMKMATNNNKNKAIPRNILSFCFAFWVQDLTFHLELTITHSIRARYLLYYNVFYVLIHSGPELSNVRA